MGEFDGLAKALKDPYNTDQFQPEGEKPFRDAKEAEKAAGDWHRYSHGSEVASAVIKTPQIAKGEVDSRPFTREKRRTNTWYKQMQGKVTNLLGYINNPNITVRSNFPNLTVAPYMKTFFRFAHDFSGMQVENQDNWKTTRDKIEDLAKKNGMIPDDVLYGSASLFQLAYAAEKARARINGKTEFMDLKLSNMGSNMSVLSYTGAPSVEPKLTFTDTRPIPAAMEKATGVFENLNINGDKVDVRVTGKLPNTEIYTAVIASHSIGGGHNYFEFKINMDGSIEGTSRWKKAKGRTPAEFIRMVLDINAHMDQVAAKQNEAYQKSQPIVPSDQYERQMPEQVKGNVDFMYKQLKEKAEKDKGLSDKDIDFYVNFGLIKGDEEWIYPEHYSSKKNDDRRTLTNDDLDKLPKGYKPGDIDIDMSDGIPSDDDSTQQAWEAISAEDKKRKGGV